MLFIFDMGGVVTNTAELLPRVLQILKMERAEFLAFCGCPENNSSPTDPMTRVSYDKHSIDLLTMCSDGMITTRQFWVEFSRRSGVPVQTDWWQHLFHPVLKEDTVALIKKLKAAGHRVVCGTNTIDGHYRNHVERGDYSYFDQTYASNFMGVSKPNPEFWKIILTAENEVPENTVFTDDRKKNCDAASALGIKSFVFTDAKKLEQDLKDELPLVLGESV